jgi:ribosomal protein S18 acetylase RimI-like enzyme
LLDQTIQPSSYTVEDCPEYLAKIDIFEIEGARLPFLHLEFKIWSPSSFKKLIDHWHVLRYCVRGPLFALSNDKDDEKWAKFVSRLGFTYLKHVDCPDGINRRCFISQQLGCG